jgi:hypothetical protein
VTLAASASVLHHFSTRNVNKTSDSNFDVILSENRFIYDGSNPEGCIVPKGCENAEFLLATAILILIYQILAITLRYLNVGLINKYSRISILLVSHRFVRIIIATSLFSSGHLY